MSENKNFTEKPRHISACASVCSTMCWCVSFLLYLNNSAESCRLHQLSEFQLQLLPGVNTLPKILELCYLAGCVCSLQLKQFMRNQCIQILKTFNTQKHYTL